MGGRGIKLSAVWRISKKDACGEGSRQLVQGPILQTSFAYLQRKRMCEIDSTSPHLAHVVLISNPRFCRFSPVGRELLPTFQRKNLSFEDMVGVQISFFQLQVFSPKSHCVDWFLRFWIE